VSIRKGGTDMTLKQADKSSQKIRLDLSCKKLRKSYVTQIGLKTENKEEAFTLIIGVAGWVWGTAFSQE